MVAHTTEEKAVPSSSPVFGAEKGEMPGAPTSPEGSSQAAPTLTSSQGSSGSSSTSTKYSSSSHTGTSSTGTAAHSPTPPPKPTNTSTKQGSSVTPKPTSSNTTSTSAEEKPKPTSTVTITDHPESTFSSNVAISVTDPSNGKVGLSTPPAVTSLGTSTGTDGGLVTYTHVIANPPPTNFASGNTRTGVLNNPGATAGVFVVVGIVASALAVCLGILIRRRRRSMRYKRYLETVQPPSRTNPFVDPPDSPQMRATEDGHLRVWDASGPAGYQGTGQHDSPRNSDHNSATGLIATAPITTHENAGSSAPMSSANSNNHGHFDYVDLGRPLDRTNNGRASVAETSPSIYPSSLPPIDDDGDIKLDYRLMDTTPTQPPGNSTAVPARPPKSHLRQSIVKPGDIIGPGDIYPSPPASTRFRQPDWLQPRSPIAITEQPVYYKVPAIQRRTLLDIRPRHAQGLEGSS